VVDGGLMERGAMRVDGHVPIDIRAGIERDARAVEI
jgi:hypothetical protein